MGAFGDVEDLSEIQTVIPKGTWKAVFDKATQNPPNTSGQVWLVLGFSIADENEKVEDFIGERPNDIFISLFPDSTADERKLWDADTKKSFKLGISTYKQVAKSLGADEMEINSGEVDWEGLFGTGVYVTIFHDKNGNARIQSDKIKLQSEVDDDIYADPTDRDI